MNITQTHPETGKGQTDHSFYKSAIIEKPRSIAYLERERVPCGPEELLIRLEGVGLCASNIPIWEGREWFQYPLEPGVPGHEGWGIIEQKGERTDGFEIGQRVALLVGNAFSEYSLVPANDAVALPADLAEVPFPGEPLGCLMNIFRRADIQQGQTVAIIGLGFLGLGLIRLCKEKGANVLALSRRDSSLRMAARDADLCIKMRDDYGVSQRVQEYTDGNGCERVIECTGKQGPLDLATEIIGDYGKLIIAGYHQDGMRNINLQKWNWKAIDVINAHERDAAKSRQGVIAAVEAVREGLIKPEELLSHAFDFEQIAEALELLRECPEGFVKAYIKF